jgi:hypothetical protein
MKLIEQPKSYSDMLTRIFWVTFATGVLCMLGLAEASLDARNFLESWSAEASVGILDGIKALYVLIPIVVALLSRVFVLHDKISNCLGIRRRFDNDNILKLLTAGVGIPTSGVPWEQVLDRRDLAMRRTFYRYASFVDPKIDVQLVRTAADRWAWFWCTVEPQIVLAIAAVMFIVSSAWTQLIIVMVLVTILIMIGLVLWPQLKRGAVSRVEEILYNEAWKAEVHSELDALVESEDRAD